MGAHLETVQLTDIYSAAFQCQHDSYCLEPHTFLFRVALQAGGGESWIVTKVAAGGAPIALMPSDTFFNSD